MHVLLGAMLRFWRGIAVVFVAKVTLAIAYDVTYYGGRPPCLNFNFPVPMEPDDKPVELTKYYCPHINKYVRLLDYPSVCIKKNYYYSESFATMTPKTVTKCRETKEDNNPIITSLFSCTKPLNTKGKEGCPNCWWIIIIVPISGLIIVVYKRHEEIIIIVRRCWFYIPVTS